MRNKAIVVAVLSILTAMNAARAESGDALINQLDAAMQAMDANPLESFDVCKAVKARISGVTGSTEAQILFLDGRASVCMAEAMFIKGFSHDGMTACDHLFVYASRLRQLVDADKAGDFINKELATAKRVAQQQACPQGFGGL